MLQRNSVRLRIYSWFMKYCHPKLGFCGRHRQVMLVGANTNTAENPSELGPKTSDTPAATEGASKASGSGSSGAEGSKGPAVQLVPFQSMPQSTQEELGKDLFDDPLLSVDNMKKLEDCMQWSFKFTKVNLLPLLVFIEY